MLQNRDQLKQVTVYGGEQKGQYYSPVADRTGINRWTQGSEQLY